MDRFRFCLSTRATTALTVSLVVLELGLASCESSGPLSTDDPDIALSTTSLVFSNSNEHQVTITNLESEPIEWRILSSTASWLTAAPENGQLGPNDNGTLIIRIDRRAVPAGTHSAALHIGAADGSILLNVSVQPGTSARAVIEPQSVVLGSSETTGRLEVVNSGTATLNWTLNGPPWATMLPASGSLTPGSRAPIVVTPVRSDLAAGRYVGTLQLASDGGSPTATLTVDVAGVSGLHTEPLVLDFGASGSRQSLRLVNDTNQAIDWHSQTGSSWISLSSSSGRLPPHLSQLLTVDVSRSGLSQGTNQSSILFISSTGSTSTTVRATITPAGSPNPSPLGPAQIDVTPASLNFGLTATELALRVHNGGDQPLEWTAQSEASWITLPTSAGRVAAHTNLPVTVRVLRSGLTPGTYQSAVRFTSSVGTVTVIIVAVVGSSPAPPPTPPPSTTPAKISVTPMSLGFGLTATELSFKIQNTGGSSLDWSALSTTGWATLPDSSGRVTAGGYQEVKVRASRVGLTAGDYQSVIQLTSNGGSANVALGLKVPSSPPLPTPAKISVTPVSLSFDLTATELSFKVQNTGGSPLTWSAQSTSVWLTMPISTGDLPAGASQDVKVRVSRAGLTAGDYQGSIQVKSNGGSPSVLVSLKVPSSPPPPTPAKVSVTPVSLDFGSTATELSFKVQNTGGSPLTWSAQSSSGWASLPISTGNLTAGASQDVKLHVTRAGLTAGNYHASIQITSNGGSGSVTLSLDVPAPPPAGGNTVNVRDFGAKGNGLADDSAAFEAAIDALPASGGTVLVPGGTYIMSAIHIGPYRPINLSRDNITIIGDGMDATVLKMAPAQYPTAAFMILINRSSGITIKNLTIDMNVGGTVYADEQSHGIRLVSSSDVRIDGVRFRNSPGDGIYLLGLAEAGDPWTERVLIENSHFVRSWRNGITVQRGVRQLQIRENTFEEISQQSISSEPSGSNASTDILVEDNLFRHWALTSSYTIAMSGTRPSDNMRRLIFRRNRVENGSVYFLWTDGLEVVGNTMIGGPYKSALRLHDVSNAVVYDNIITGIKQNESGVVQILNEDNQLSSDIALRNNRIDVAPGLTGIYVRDASGGITITGNEISGWGSGYGILFANLITTGTVRSGFHVIGNVVNDFANGIGFIVRGESFANVEVKSNTIDDESPATVTSGVLFDGTGPYGSFAEVVSNIFGPGITTPIRIR